MEFVKSSPGNPYTGLNQMTYAFLHHDPCESEYFTPWHTRVVRKFFLAQRVDLTYRTLLAGGAYTYDKIKKSAAIMAKVPTFRSMYQPLLRTVGCAAPKLRVTRNVRSVPTEQAALKALETVARLDEPVILTTDESVSNVAGEVNAVVRVSRTAADRLDVNVHVPGNLPAWLVYADSWDANWSATVNGKAQKVVPAYAAFKAVRVPAGRSRVRFAYLPSRASPFMLLAGLSTLAQGMCAVGGVVLLVMRHRRRRRES